MTFRCGNSLKERHTHETVIEAKECFGLTTQFPTVEQYARAKMEDTRFIEKLLPQERAHYAVEIDGELRFYKVDIPMFKKDWNGRWRNRIFVSVQASEEYYPIRNQQNRVEILKAIAEDPQAAMLRYGLELGRCGHCHRTLTNEESRRRGIGPICSSKLGW